MDGVTVFLIIVALAAVAAIVVEVLKYIENNRTYAPRDISLAEEWVEDAFFDYAEYFTKIEYERFDKPIMTQKGDYRADFTKQVNIVAADAINACCEGDMLSSDFCNFIEKEYPSFKQKELYLAIFDYLNATKKELRQKEETIQQREPGITPAEFFRLKQRQTGDVVGVYIIHNMTQDLYYVGQAKKLFFRVNQHFTGHGNGDVYADYKYGDQFSIQMIKLSGSGYDDIDKLERDMIKKYNAYRRGYNRTSGNH